MKKFQFYYPIEVRYRDLDTLNHVNNATYLTFLEHARLKYYDELGLWGGSDIKDVTTVTVDVHVAYHSPIYLGQTVNIGTRIKKIGNKSIAIEQQIENIKTGEVHAVAAFVAVAFDLRSQRSIQVSDEYRRKIRDYESEVEDAAAAG